MKRLPWTTCLLGHKHTNRKIFSLPPGVSHDDDYKTEVNQQKTKIFESHIGAPQSPEMVAKCDYTAVWSHHRLFSCHALCNTCCRQRWQSSLNKGERYIEKLMDMLLKQPFWFTGYWLKTTPAKARAVFDINVRHEILFEHQRFAAEFKCSNKQQGQFCQLQYIISFNPHTHKQTLSKAGQRLGAYDNNKSELEWLRKPPDVIQNAWRHSWLLCSFEWPW